MMFEDRIKLETAYIAERKKALPDMSFETEIIMRVSFAAGIELGYSLGRRDGDDGRLAAIHGALGLADESPQP